MRKRYVKKKHGRQHQKPAYVSYNSSSKTYVCLLCQNELHEQVPYEWYPWEIPRHLEKRHHIPEDAKKWRMKFINGWDETLEQQYLVNLDEQINYPKEAKEDLETDTRIAEEIRKKAQERKQIEQQTERDAY